MNKLGFWVWPLVIAVCFGFGIWVLGSGLVGCGNPLSNPYVPAVRTVIPANGSQGNDLNCVVSITFDLVMEPGSFGGGNFSLSSPEGAVGGTITSESGNKTIFFYPASALQTSTVYTAGISENVAAFDGTRLGSAYSWSFTTGALTSAVGTPDASFSDGSNVGSVAYSRPSRGEQARLDHNGKIVVCGMAGDNLALWRYLPDGTADNTFGNGGIVTGDAMIGRAFDFDGQGNIILAAEGYWPGGHGWALSKIDEQGSLVPNFGTRGAIIPGVARSMAVDPSGNIYVAGYFDALSGTRESAMLWKFKPDGSPDTNFGDGIRVGSLEANMAGQSYAEADKVLLDANGKVLLVGSGVWRFNPDGSPDSFFGTGGVAEGGSLWASAALDQAGNIYVTGLAGLRKYDGSGALKIKVMFQSGSSSYDFPIGMRFYDIIVDPFGKVMLAGNIDNHSNGKDPAIWRYDSSLVLDPSFGNGGLVWQGTTIDSDQVAASLQIDQLGRVIAAGIKVLGSGFFSSARMAIWRYR